MIRHRVESGERRPDRNMTALIVTSPAGVIVAILFFVLGWVGLPEARPFLVEAALIPPA